ncbi:uncharacterized protein CLUP02_16310 [Colletotrichum lupini]|uniref:Uncharacterized protein n=1 Tax=Colletotrichum lupini TaxID=145971 RepID=A0A9Q8T873_9PEZI|nr:uncharacterized protein CLUP02_16310 [Colletotrichum lupini]UQC90780.1 hypothetical protein CLUP02_16310 [Colletotrichum lupini]
MTPIRVAAKMTKPIGRTSSVPALYNGSFLLSVVKFSYGLWNYTEGEDGRQCKKVYLVWPSFLPPIHRTWHQFVPSLPCPDLTMLPFALLPSKEKHKSLSILAPGHRLPHPPVIFPHTPRSDYSFWVPRLHFPRPLCPRSSLGVFKVFPFFVFLRRRRCKKLAHTPSPSGPTPTQSYANPALPLYLVFLADCHPSVLSKHFLLPPSLWEISPGWEPIAVWSGLVSTCFSSVISSPADAYNTSTASYIDDRLTSRLGLCVTNPHSPRPFNDAVIPSRVRPAAARPGAIKSSVALGPSSSPFDWKRRHLHRGNNNARITKFLLDPQYQHTHAQPPPDRPRYPAPVSFDFIGENQGISTALLHCHHSLGHDNHHRLRGEKKKEFETAQRHVAVVGWGKERQHKQPVQNHENVEWEDPADRNHLSGVDNDQVHPKEYLHQILNACVPGMTSDKSTWHNTIASSHHHRSSISLFNPTSGYPTAPVRIHLSDTNLRTSNFDI